MFCYTSSMHACNDMETFIPVTSCLNHHHDQAQTGSLFFTRVAHFHGCVLQATRVRCCSASKAVRICARGGETSSSRLLRFWPRFSTNQLHGTEYGQDKGGGWCKQRTERHRDRRQHVRGSARAVSLSSGRRGATTPVRRSSGEGLPLLATPSKAGAANEVIGSSAQRKEEEQAQKREELLQDEKRVKLLGEAHKLLELPALSAEKFARLRDLNDPGFPLSRHLLRPRPKRRKKRERKLPKSGRRVPLFAARCLARQRIHVEAPKSLDIFSSSPLPIVSVFGGSWKNFTHFLRPHGPRCRFRLVRCLRVA